MERLIFIDTTRLTTNRTKACCWAPLGDPLIDHIPAGRGNRQTVIAGLRHDRIDVTGAINGAMDREMFALSIDGILAPALRAGDVFGPLIQTRGLRGLTSRQVASLKEHQAPANT